MTQNVIFQGCDLERSRASVEVKQFSIRLPPPTHKYTCEISLKSYCQFSLYGRVIVDQRWPGERSENKEETIWQTLGLCDANYALKGCTDVKVTGSYYLLLPIIMFLVKLVCLSVCLFVDNITQQVMNGLWWNYVKGSWVVYTRVVKLLLCAYYYYYYFIYLNSLLLLLLLLRYMFKQPITITITRKIKTAYYYYYYFSNYYNYFPDYYYYFPILLLLPILLHYCWTKQTQHKQIIKTFITSLYNTLLQILSQKISDMYIYSPNFRIYNINCYFHRFNFSLLNDTCQSPNSWYINI